MEVNYTTKYIKRKKIAVRISSRTAVIMIHDENIMKLSAVIN